MGSSPSFKPAALAPGLSRLMTPDRGTAQSVLFTTSSEIGPGRSSIASFASDDEGMPSDDLTAACLLAAQPAPPAARARIRARAGKRAVRDGFIDAGMDG